MLDARDKYILVPIGTSTSRARHGGASGIASVTEREFVVMRSTTLLSSFWSFCLVFQAVRRSGREGRWARTLSGIFIYFKLRVWTTDSRTLGPIFASTYAQFLHQSRMAHFSKYPKTRPGTLRPMPLPSKSAFGAINIRRYLKIDMRNLWAEALVPFPWPTKTDVRCPFVRSVRSSIQRFSRVVTKMTLKKRT